MFGKISSATAADAHSFSSLASAFTRPPKPTPLNSRSLLQMFRKISSATAADVHSFSSLASPFTRPPKPTPLNSRNSTSRSTIPAETTSSCPNNWLYGPKNRLSTARLQKFLQINCKSADVSAYEAFRFFHRMVQMEPRFPLYSFNLLLRGLAENERYYDVLSLYGTMNVVGLIPNFVTLNILLKCLCNANRVCDGFLVMGRIMRMGYSPNMETFNSLLEGLFIGNRAADAVQLYLRLRKGFDCFPDATTWSILIRRLYTPEYMSGALIFKGMISENGQYGGRGQPNVVSNSCIIDNLCKEGKEDKATELSSDVDAPGHQPLSVNPMAEHVKGQEDFKPNIHMKEKSPTCLAGATPHDQPNLEARREHFLRTVIFEGMFPPESNVVIG